MTTDIEVDDLSDLEHTERKAAYDERMRRTTRRILSRDAYYFGRWIAAAQVYRPRTPERRRLIRMARHWRQTMLMDARLAADVL